MPAAPSARKPPQHMYGSGDMRRFSRIHFSTARLRESRRSGQRTRGCDSSISSEFVCGVVAAWAQ